MTIKKKLLIGTAVLLIVLITAGVTAVAVSNYGSQSDPLVTLSYLNQTVQPDILEELDDELSVTKTSIASQFDSKINSFTKSVENMISGSGSSDGSSRFVVLTLSNGQTLTCSAGAEIMLRVGTAASYGSNSPQLVDETDGSSVSSAGTSLKTNHMYMVTIQGNGIKATSSSVKVLVRGTYTIG